MNGIRCDKLSMAVATVRAYPDKYEKDFDTVVTFLTQYIDKRELTQSMEVASIALSDLPNGRRPTLFMALSMEQLS